MLPLPSAVVGTSLKVSLISISKSDGDSQSKSIFEAQNLIRPHYYPTSLHAFLARVDKSIRRRNIFGINFQTERGLCWKQFS